MFATLDVVTAVGTVISVGIVMVVGVVTEVVSSCKQLFPTAQLGWMV